MRVRKTAVVTGGNRGIGLAVCEELARREHRVVMGSRDVAKGDAAARSLGLDDVTAMRLDVSDPASVRSFVEELGIDELDVLVNNAGAVYDTWQSAANADLGIVSDALETNLLGTWRLTMALVPLLGRSGHGRVVNVSSEMGSLARMAADAPAYRVSKAALNALTRMLADDLRDDGILVNAVNPGWTATEMGEWLGRSPADAAASIVWAATLPDDGPTGGFFRDGEAVPW